MSMAGEPELEGQPRQVPNAIGNLMKGAAKTKLIQQGVQSDAGFPLKHAREMKGRTEHGPRQAIQRHLLAKFFREHDAGGIRQVAVHPARFGAARLLFAPVSAADKRVSLDQERGSRFLDGERLRRSSAQ